MSWILPTRECSAAPRADHSTIRPFRVEEPQVDLDALRQRLVMRYFYNTSGTIVGRHTDGFPSELEAYQVVEHVREELAIAPIIGESEPKGALSEMAEVDGAVVRYPRHKKGVRK